VIRQVRWKQPQQFMDHAEGRTPVLEEHRVGREDIGFEFMLNALRLTEGVPVALFAERTGYPLTLVQGALEAAEQRGLIERDHLRLRPTALGRRFLNDLQALFLPAPRADATARPAPVAIAMMTDGPRGGRP